MIFATNFWNPKWNSECQRNLFLCLQKLGRITLNCDGHNMFSRKKNQVKRKNNNKNKYLSKQTRFLKIRNSYFGNTCGEQDTFTQDVKEEKFLHPLLILLVFMQNQSSCRWSVVFRYWLRRSGIVTVETTVEACDNNTTVSNPFLKLFSCWYLFKMCTYRRNSWRNRLPAASLTKFW